MILGERDLWLSAELNQCNACNVTTSRRLVHVTALRALVAIYTSVTVSSAQLLIRIVGILSEPTKTCAYYSITNFVTLRSIDLLKTAYGWFQCILFHGDTRALYLYHCVYRGITNRKRMSAALRVVTSHSCKTLYVYINAVDFHYLWDVNKTLAPS